MGELISQLPVAEEQLPFVEEQLPVAEDRRTFRSRKVLVGLAAALALAGCTSQTNANSSDNAANRMKCSANPASSWQPVGDNFKDGTVAALLGVSEDEVKTNGKFGPVSCPEKIELLDVANHDGRIVSVTGEGINCLVYYKEEDNEKQGDAVCVSRD